MSARLGALRLEASGARLACAGVVFIVSLATYSLTLAPTVTLVDSGELIVAARNLGVAHPPGFPLYVLLAHVATRIPLGDVAERVNACSALFAALAAGVTALAFRELVLGLGAAATGVPRRAKRRARKGPATAEARAPHP